MLHSPCVGFLECVDQVHLNGTEAQYRFPASNESTFACCHFCKSADVSRGRAPAFSRTTVDILVFVEAGCPILHTVMSHDDVISMLLPRLRLRAPARFQAPQRRSVVRWAANSAASASAEPRAGDEGDPFEHRDHRLAECSLFLHAAGTAPGVGPPPAAGHRRSRVQPQSISERQQKRASKRE